MRIIFTLIAICMFPIFSVGQVGINSTVTFTVKAIETDIAVWPADSIMWGDSTKQITVTSEGYEIEKVVLKGGKIGHQGQYYYCKPDTGESVILEVYVKHPSGETRLGFVKPYEVKRIPDPTIYVCGVRADSTIDKHQLLEFNQITGTIKGFEHIPVRVQKFDFIIFSGTEADTMHAATDRFTIQMRRKMHTLIPGQIISFENIICQGPGGKSWAILPIELFVDESNKFKTGTHVIPGQK